METTKGMHPLIAIAAVSVTVFSLVGIGAVTGLIPTGHSQTPQSQTAQVEAVKPADAPAKLLVETKPAEAPPAVAPQPGTPKPVKHKVAAKQVRPVASATRAADEPVRVAKADIPVTVAQTPLPPPTQPAPYVEAVKPVCHECGVIDSVREIEKPGQASGSGAAIGGIAGGILGNQTGRGHGRDVMTVLGAIGGAIAGHEIEKNTHKVRSYQIGIRFDDGSTQLITQDTPPAWRPGDRVKLVNGVIGPNNG